MFWILTTLAFFVRDACLENSKHFIFSKDYYLEASFVSEKKYEYLIGVFDAKQNHVKCTGFIVTENRAVTTSGCFEFLQTDTELLVNVKFLKILPKNGSIKRVFLDTRRRLVTSYVYMVGLAIIEVEKPFENGFSFVKLLDKDDDSFQASFQKFTGTKDCEVVGYEYVVEEKISKLILVPVVFVESKKCNIGMFCGRIRYGKNGTIKANEFGVSGAPVVCKGRPFGIYAERISDDDLVLFYSLQGENKLSEGVIKDKMMQGNILIHSNSNVQKLFFPILSILIFV